MPKRISAGMKQVHKAEALDRLREMLVNGQGVYNIEVNRAPSGMSARYKFFVPFSAPVYEKDVIVRDEMGIRDITLDVATVSGMSYDRDKGTVRIDGCGLNRPQHLLDSVAYALVPEGGKYGDFMLRERGL